MSDDQDVDDIAWYLVDCVTDGLDNQVVVQKTSGDEVEMQRGEGLRVFYIECIREGEECTVAVAVGLSAVEIALAVKSGP